MYVYPTAEYIYYEAFKSTNWNDRRSTYESGKKYITPEMEITEFETEDVITASGGGNVNGGGIPELPEQGF